MKIASEEEDVEDVAVQKALQLAKEIEIPAEVLAKESIVIATQLGLELTKNLQQIAVADVMVEATEVAQEEAGCSKAHVASEAPVGNSNSHTPAEIITVESSTSPDTSSKSTSSSSSIPSDPDDIPLSKVYNTLNKALSPSPSSKTHKNPASDIFVPMYPSVEDRLIDLQQRRIDACKNLPADHPLQPPVIEPIQSIPVDAEGADDHTVINFANINVSSPHPTSPTTETSEPSIIQNLVNYYSGELPEYETNQEQASDIASDEVMTKSPQQHEPNLEMVSSTNINFVHIPDSVPEQNVPELVLPEQPVPELSVSKQVILNQQPTTNTSTEPEISLNDQPSSSNLAIQPVAPAALSLLKPSWKKQESEKRISSGAMMNSKRK